MLQGFTIDIAMHGRSLKQLQPVCVPQDLNGTCSTTVLSQSFDGSPGGSHWSTLGTADAAEMMRGGCKDPLVFGGYIDTTGTGFRHAKE